MPPVNSSPIEARTGDGRVLRGVHHESSAPRACAVLGHAMMVDRRTMDRPPGEGLASTLAAHGIAALNFDLRGHGESGPTARDGSRWSYDDIVRHDVPAMVAEGRRRYPEAPTVVVGHSLAGHAAMIAAGLDPAAAPDAIVALAPNLWAPRFEPSARRRALKRATILAWAAMSAPVGRFESRAFRMGTTAEPWSYVRDLVRFWRTDELLSADGRTDYLEALARAELPVLVVSSEGDTLLAHPVAVARFAGTMWRARLSHRTIRAGDVSPPPDHMELVTSERSRPVWDEIARYILETSRRTASGGPGSRSPHGSSYRGSS